MDTTRSERMSREFLQSPNGLTRKSIRVEKRFSHPAGAVFEQLCPSRELDWIDGWECDLVHTSTGYMEADCIFTTPENCSMGPGLWVITAYEPDRLLELVFAQVVPGFSRL